MDCWFSFLYFPYFETLSLVRPHRIGGKSSGRLGFCLSIITGCVFWLMYTETLKAQERTVCAYPSFTTAAVIQDNQSCIKTLQDSKVPQR